MDTNELDPPIGPRRGPRAKDGAVADSPIELETGTNPTASVIWLHGLGADGNDFVPIVRELGLASNPAVRFIFPHAPYRPVTINGGYVMRAWYDLGVSERGLWQNPDHVRESERVVHALIRREVGRGIVAARIVLAGFSQGGAIVLHAGLHHPEPLAGILALSAPVPRALELIAEIDTANVGTPIFLAHGRQDTVVPFVIGEQTRARFAERGLNMEWHGYDMGHSICQEEVADMARWFGRILSARTL